VALSLIPMLASRFMTNRIAQAKSGHPGL